MTWTPGTPPPAPEPAPEPPSGAPSESPPGDGPPATPGAEPAVVDRTPDPEPRWPGWFAPVGFLTALTLIVVGGAILTAAAAALGTEPGDNAPAFNVAGTFVQDVAFVIAPLLLAAQTMPPRAWHFGLRRTPLLPAVGWAVAAAVAFLALQVVYNLVLQPKERQEVAENLGVAQGPGWLVLGVIVVVVLAPIAEEFFFRGFFFRAARNGLAARLGERRGMLAAAAVTGIVFGLMHALGSPAVTIPPLALFGFFLCLLYERTGSLYAPIALHAANNAFAFSFLADDSAAVAAPVGVAMIAACAVLPRVLHRPPEVRAAPA